MDDYYNQISRSYNELHGQEQLKKLEIIKEKLLEFYSEKELKEIKILDIGGGTGIASFDNATLLDPSEDLLKIAERKDKEENKKLRKTVVGRAEELPFEDESFDLIISLTALHHSDIRKAINEIRRVVRKKKELSDQKINIVLSILKRANKFDEIDKEIEEQLKVISKIEEEKDVIYFLTNPS